jgi:hypothetical protein
MTASFRKTRLPFGTLMLIGAICAILAMQTIRCVAIFPKRDPTSAALFDAATPETLVVAAPSRNSASASTNNGTKTIMLAESQVLPPHLSSTNTGCSVPDLSIALSCLHQSTPNLKLSYPNDAKEHFLEIHQALRRWTDKSKPHCHARFCGPWIENHWIDRFYNLTRDEASCLSDSFGPFVPLLIPWVDLWVNRPKKFKYPKGFVQTLMGVLRPDVPYITVSQNDQGLPANEEIPQMNNILVLSAGGYGHVPIPLLKQDESQVEPIPHPRKWLVSYVGSLGHAPDEMRQRMHDYFVNESGVSFTQYYGKSDMWKNIMANSYMSLAPRGYGRTSYHIMETLQMGLIPIHVYIDVPWVPYLKLFRTLGFITTVGELPQLLQTINGTMTPDDFRARELRIVGHRDSHFSVSGILDQIGLFLKGRGDLECVPLPKQVRGDPNTNE